VNRDSVLVHHGLAEAMVTRFAGGGGTSDSGGRDLIMGFWEVKVE
jgi:hypothetical protein